MKKIFSTLIILVALHSLGLQAENYANTLQAAKKVEIPLNECKEMEQKVGQLLYINVDGFDSNFTIDPAYDRLVKRIQPGGVLPKYNSSNPVKIKRASETLQSMSVNPLLIGIDSKNVEPDIGLGFGCGMANELGGVDEGCFEKVALIEAALHKYLGINHSLGPTVKYNPKCGGLLAGEDRYKIPRLERVLTSFNRVGVETTLKHFPYTPGNFNLHHDNRDTAVSRSVVFSRHLPVFSALKNQSGILMTTHLYNSNIDPNNMATFSKTWIDILKKDVGFKELVMTDALFMIDSYKGNMRQMAQNWPFIDDINLSDDLTIFAVKAILAGHDMVLLESAAAETERIWKSLVAVSCKN